MNKTIEEYLKQKQSELVIYDCEICGKHIEKSGKSFRRNPHLLCKRCFMIQKYGTTSNIGRPEVQEKRKQTFLKKYNSNTPMASQEVRDKIKKTNLEKYGVENVFQSKEVKEKIKNKIDYKKIQESIQKTNIEKYGTHCTLCVPEVKDKIKKTNLEKYGVEYPSQSKEVQEKIKSTCMEKYGTEYVSQSNYAKEKSKQTCTKNLGVEYPAQSKEVKEKVIKTNIEKYGTPCTLNVQEVKEKIKETNLKKYGTEHPSQCETVKEKTKQTCLEKYGNYTYLMSDDYHSKAHNKYRYKGEVFDSSWELAYWIYCIDHNIDIHRNTVPNKRSDGKDIYFDFISNGKYIEIKGDHLQNQEDWPIRLDAYIKYNVKVIMRKDIEDILKYIYHKYGKNYLNSFKDKKASDFKRDIIEADIPDLEKYKNKNVRFHYKCNECGKDVFTTYHILTHFNDGLCKQCRKLMNKKEDTN